jgi:hypothetical protein
MQDLSLHILDIVENSIDACASRIEICIRELVKEDCLTLEISDNGRGMDAVTTKMAKDPFFTTRTIKPVGLGLSLLSESARATGGGLEIESAPGKGTRIVATFRQSHIDMKPLGDIPQTLVTLLIGHPEIELRYAHFIGEESFVWHTRELSDGHSFSPGRFLETKKQLRDGLDELARRTGRR